MRWGKLRKIHLIRASLALSVLLFAASGQAFADTIVRGFKATTPLEPGIIVALDKSSKNTVEPVPGKEAERIYGVVIDPAQAPLTVRQQGQQTFVAIGGNYSVLVSNENGNIQTGDYVSISSIDGIGAKASQQSTVLGRALEGFDGKSDVITTTSDGHALGSIELSIVPGKNPLVKNDISIPAPLKRFGEAVAGKNVSAARIYAALAIFFATSVIAAIVLWVGIRSGIIAIGRNPLSKHSIMSSLVQVVITAVLIFIVGMFGVYLLLRL
jgi:hypothetical protein